MTTFRTSRQKLTTSWLSNGEGGLVGYTLDLLKDTFARRLELGLLVRFPQQGPDGSPAPEDALAALGRDRRVIRGINETGEHYATRLIPWLDDRKTAGNPFSLMKKLSEYCGSACAFRTVDVRGNWYSREADGTISVLLKTANWDWDGATDALTRWSRFWVIIYPNGVWSEGQAWGDAGTQDWGDPGHTWGSTATPDEVVSTRSIVADWKPAGTRCVNIILAFDNASFDPANLVNTPGMPNGLWGHWSKNVAGVQVPARLATARYWDGV